MATRFTRVFSLENNLYAQGSPLIITAGALLSDNETKKSIVQLKFKNITNKTIKSVKVIITPRDIAGRILGSPIVYEYLDLFENRDMEFGSKIPVILPNSNTRKYDVQVTEVIFESNEIWTSKSNDWKPIPAQNPLLTQDAELRKQFNLEISSKATLEYKEVKDLWLCSCGAINRSNENYCHSCSINYDKLKNVDFSLLEEHKNERLALEAEEKEKEAIRKKELQAENTKRMKKLGMICAPIIAILLAIYLINAMVIKPARDYKTAVATMEAGNIDEAISEFEKLGSYKDSENMLLECKYRIATEEMRSGEFEDGLNHFLELGDYKDSAEQYDFYNGYTDAIEQIVGNFNYDDGLKFFQSHPDYINSAGWCDMANAVKAYKEDNYETAYNEICKIDKDDFCCNDISTQTYDAYYASIGAMYAFKTDPFSVKEAVEILKNINTEYSDVSEPLEILEPMADCDGTYTCTDSDHQNLEITLTHLMHNGGSYTVNIKHNFDNVTFNDDPKIYYAKDGIHDWQVTLLGKVNGNDQVFYFYYDSTEIVVDGGKAGEKRTYNNLNYINGSDFGTYTFKKKN